MILNFHNFFWKGNTVDAVKAGPGDVEDCDSEALTAGAQRSAAATGRTRPGNSRTARDCCATQHPSEAGGTWPRLPATSASCPLV